MKRVVLKSGGDELPIVLTDRTATVAERADDRMAPAEVRYVLQSWLTTYRENSGEMPRIRGDIYFREHHKLIADIARRPGAAILLATVEAEPSVIVGFGCAEPVRGVVHYCHTKDGFRRAGLMRELFAAFAEIGSWPADHQAIGTHSTFYIEKIWGQSNAWKRRLAYNPYRRAAA